MTRPAGSSWLIVGLLVLWLASLVFLVAFRGAIQDRWMLQDTPKELAYAGIVSALFFLPVVIALIGMARARRQSFPWHELGGWILCSALSGWYGGPIALNLRNHSGSASAQPVEFKAVKHLKQAMSLRIAGEGYDDVTFTCAIGTWRKHYVEARRTASGFIYRGRLGLLWGELREK
jgi:hypothetical protein